MEYINTFISNYGQYTPQIFFFLLMLAGLNVPISEDALLIAGGIIANTLAANEAINLFLWILAGCYFSAWEAYWLGRLLGPRLTKLKVFRHVISPARIKKIENFYEQHSFLTLFFGRFIPFGVRNAIYITAGMGRLSFPQFIIKDLAGCLLSTSFLFTSAYYCGKNSQKIYHYIHIYQSFLLLIMSLFAVVGICLYLRKLKYVKLVPSQNTN
jgi:membrane-associated protein